MLALGLTLSLAANACSTESNDPNEQARRRQSLSTPAQTRAESPRAREFLGTPVPGEVVPLRRAKWVGSLPSLVVSNGSEVRRFWQDGTTLMGSVDGTARVAFNIGAGRVVVERAYGQVPEQTYWRPYGARRSDLVYMRRGRSAERIDVGDAEYVWLQDVDFIEGSRQILYTTFEEEAAKKNVGRGTAQSAHWGYLYLQDLRSDERRRVTYARAHEYNVVRATHGGEAIAVSVYGEGTGWIRFFQADGRELKGRPTPREDSGCLRSACLSDAVLSSDGKLLSYLSGSTFGGGRVVGDWVAVVVGQTGRELLRVRVAKSNLCISWLDFDGRWLVMSRIGQTREKSGQPSCDESKPLPVLVLDSQAARLRLVELPEVVGLATIED